MHDEKLYNDCVITLKHRNMGIQKTYYQYTFYGLLKSKTIMETGFLDTYVLWKMTLQISSASM